MSAVGWVEAIRPIPIATSTAAPLIRLNPNLRVARQAPPNEQFSRFFHVRSNVERTPAVNNARTQLVDQSRRTMAAGLHRSGLRMAGKFRAWLLLLDPTGGWEARVRLGIKPRPLISCPVCGKDASVRFAGFFDDSGARRLACRSCNITFRLPDDSQGSHLLETAVAYDPLITRKRRERKRNRSP